MVAKSSVPGFSHISSTPDCADTLTKPMKRKKNNGKNKYFLMFIILNQWI
jgi:hypothetical protein